MLSSFAICFYNKRKSPLLQAAGRAHFLRALPARAVRVVKIKPANWQFRKILLLQFFQKVGIIK
ncbi:MAG: hypothetical protein FWG66_15785, partial [Spirochaetes bacterium]|nr:hypothetical protein [Spirochaetota bacterium]